MEAEKAAELNGIDFNINISLSPLVPIEITVVCQEFLSVKYPYNETLMSRTPQ